MSLEELLNSDDIEVATLAASILRKEKGKSYVGNLIRKNDKYEFKKGQGLVKKNNWNWVNNVFSSFKLVNTPLLNMTDIQNNTIYVKEESKITFDLPYKPGE